MRSWFFDPFAALRRCQADVREQQRTVGVNVVAALALAAILIPLASAQQNPPSAGQNPPAPSQNPQAAAQQPAAQNPHDAR